MELSSSTLTFEIPATQYYNHLYTEGYGSFVSGVVPAVAAAEGVDKEKDVNVTLQPVVSYLSIPIKGVGKVGSVKLAMKVGEAEVNLAGEVNVNLAQPDKTQKNIVDGKEVTEETFFTIYKNFQEDIITLDCGDSVDLNPETAKYFMFVIPAYLDLSQKVDFTITVADTEGNETKYSRTIDAGKLKSTYRNYILHYDSADITWSESGAYIISNEYEFLMYADAATNGTKTIGAIWNNDSQLRPAVIVNPLNFEEFNTDPTLSQVEKDVADYLKNLLAAYKENDYAIPTIGAGDKAAKFELEGNVNGKVATINGLTVKGTSMFYDGMDNGQEKFENAVKNITFTNSTVDATGLKSDAFFLTNRYFTNGIQFDGVTVGEGCDVLVDSDNGATPAVKCEKAVIGRAFTSFDGNDEVTNNVEGLNYANVLNVKSNYANFNPEDEDCIDITYNKLTVHSLHDGAILNVKDEAAAAEMIEKIDLTIGGAKWYSVVSGYKAATTGTTATTASVEMSYWTGTSAGNVIQDEIFTAEELASVVNAGDGTAKLTNDINLMGGVELSEGLATAKHSGLNWGDVLSKVDDVAKKAKVDGTKGTDGKYTISNVWVVPEKQTVATETTAAVSVFGVRVALKNVKVDNAYVSDQNVGVVSKGISGLAIFAQDFEGVEVTNMLISAHENTTVGGLAQFIRNGGQLKNVSFSGRIAQQKKALIRGTIAGKFECLDATATNTYSFTGMKAVGIGSSANLPVFGEVALKKAANVASAGGEKYDVEVNFFYFDAIMPTNFVPYANATEDVKIRVTTSPNDQEGTYKDFSVKAPQKD